jgi:hypothetical protein
MEQHGDAKLPELCTCSPIVRRLRPLASTIEKAIYGRASRWSTSDSLKPAATAPFYAEQTEPDPQQQPRPRLRHRCEVEREISVE